MVDITFKGEFIFEDNSSLKDALKEVKELIEEEDKSVSEIWRTSYQISGKTILVDINTGCAQDDFWAYEGIIETLAENAIDGKVEGWRDDYEDGYKEIYEVSEDDYDL